MNYATYGTTVDIETVRRMVEAELHVEMEARMSDFTGEYYLWRAAPFGIECEEISVVPNLDGDDELVFPDHPELHTIIEVTFETSVDRVLPALTSAGAEPLKLR